MKKIITIFFAAAAVLSCSKSANLSQVETAKGVVAVAKDFEGATKTTITTGGSFSWAEGDVIGVVPMDNKTFQTNYEVKAVGTDPKSASFDGGAWALKEGKSYAAYYPCQSIVLTSEGTAAVSFTGQEQAANNSTAHLGAYDYMYAQAVSPAAGTATFAFQHQVSLVKVTLPVKDDGTYVGLTLSCEDNVFAKNATLSIADGSLAAGDVLSNISLSLKELDLKANDNLEAYLIVLPTTAVNGKVLSATLVSSEGTQTSYNITTTVPSFEAGKAYALAGAVDSNVLFSDDFSWIAPVIKTYNTGKTADKICADFVNGTYTDLDARLTAGNTYSPNLYSVVGETAFAEALAQKGYTDLAAANKTIYGQGTEKNPYLKFGKKDTQTALSIMPFKEAGTTATISLDWSHHMTATALDVVSLRIMIDGEGTFDNSAKSVDFTHTMTEPGDPSWNSVSVVVSGANADTRIIITTKEGEEAATKYKQAGQHRFYIDNLKVEKVEE